jgi:hypothetical protein
MNLLEPKQRQAMRDMEATSKGIMVTSLNKVHLIWYLVSLTIQNSKVLYLFDVRVISYQAKLLMITNIQTIDLTFVGKI